MDIEHEKGISGKDYYYSDEGLLKDYREVYMQKAMRVVELSHQIVGSSALSRLRHARKSPPPAGFLCPPARAPGRRIDARRLKTSPVPPMFGNEVSNSPGPT